VRVASPHIWLNDRYGRIVTTPKAPGPAKPAANTTQRLTPRSAVEFADGCVRLYKAMEEQFEPPIGKPLDVLEVSRLEEEEVVRLGLENINDFCGLAALHAYLGHAETALLWCDRAHECIKTQDRQPADWQLRQSRFALRLRGAIRTGQVRSFLRSVKEGQYRE
jgi:hypothetical protein